MIMTRINKKDIRNVRLCSKESPEGKVIHTVEMKDGTTHDFTTGEMKELNLIKMRGTRHRKVW